MTDRPTYPLSKEQYLEVVLASKMRPHTTEIFMENYDLISSVTRDMACQAACEAHWSNNIHAWTDEGRKAVEQIIVSVACCASYHINHVLEGHTLPTDAYLGLRALVGNRYRAWRAPSETYMCM